MSPTELKEIVCTEIDSKKDELNELSQEHPLKLPSLQNMVIQKVWKLVFVVNMMPYLA